MTAALPVLALLTAQGAAPAAEIGAGYRHELLSRGADWTELSVEAAMGDEGRKKLFLAVVRGWFPVGLDILRAFPAGAKASPEELLGALWAWCERYFPEGGAPGLELGVRVER